MSKLEVDAIEPQSVTTLTIGASGNTITVPNGSLSGQNYPAFFARLDGSQSVSDNTNTKVTINEEYFDTDSCFDHTTNYRFTPNVAGKYYIYGQIWLDTGTNASNFKLGTAMIYKNGALLSINRVDARNSYLGRLQTITTTFIDTANGSTDYYELFGNVDNNTGGSPAFYATSSGTDGYTTFGAYRIGD
jgi:hypothetical protein